MNNIKRWRHETIKWFDLMGIFGLDTWKMDDDDDY